MSASMSIRDLRSIGVFGHAEVHVAEALGRLGDDHRCEVLVAAALAVRAPRHGHVAVDLRTVAESVLTDVDADPVVGGDATDEAATAIASLDWPEPERWRELLASSPLVAVVEGPDGLPEPSAPLVLDGDLVYLQRYWAFERIVADEVRARGAVTPSVVGERTSIATALLTGPGSDRQLAAVDAALRRGLTVIAGGPGTGKTTTVAALVAVLVDGAGRGDAATPGLRVALAAPTGKAAARLAAAFRDAVSRLPDHVAARLEAVESSTVHRLLGTMPGRQVGFRHDRAHPLPHDVVIVDEASMVSLPLMARLLVAVRPDARLVVVGDPGQLASVEAGSVLADLVGERPARVADAGPGTDTGATTGLDGSVVELTHSRRFPPGSPLDRLAGAVRAGDARRALDMLSDPQAADADAGGLVWIPEPADRPDVAAHLRDLVLPSAVDTVVAASAADESAALAALDRVRLLCAHRTGPFGVARWNRLVERWLANAGHDVSGWYPGRPVMVTANDYRLSLFNGDLGVTLDTEPRRTVAFPDVGGARRIAAARLDAIETVHALTIHKSQGSEFDHVIVVLRGADSRLATRELLYTAITRARGRVTVVGSADSVTAAVERRTVRTSGLGARLWGASPFASP